MSLSFHLKKIIAAFGLYDSAAQVLLKGLAIRKGIRFENSETDHGPVIRFHGSQERCIVLSRRHIMYGSDVINFFDYYYNAVMPSSRNGESVVDYSQPAWHSLNPSEVKFHFSSLPESDTTTTIYLEKGGLGPGQVVIDLGGYCGASSYFFAKAVGPGGRVLCLEPDSLNYNSLLKNIEFHHLDNVTPLPMAAWSHTGKLYFKMEGNMGSGAQETHPRGTNSVEINSITLDELAAQQKLDRIDFIKIDIEGAETVVLRHAANLLTKYRPRLMIEPHPVAGKFNTDEIVQILNRMGYRSELLPQGDLETPLIFGVYP